VEKKIKPFSAPFHIRILNVPPVRGSKMLPKPRF